MIAFINKYGDRFGVEFLCRTLCAAVRGFLTTREYRAAKARTLSARQLHDEIFVPEVQQLHRKNYSAYGVRRMHAKLLREGGRSVVTRPHVSCGMLGVRRVSRSKKITTKGDPKDQLAGDRVERQFTVFGPKLLLVCNIKYVATWSGFVYVSFVTDVLPLQALEMTACQLGGDLEGAIRHSDHGSNHMATVHTSRVEELSAIPSTGIVGDSYDNAMAEAVNGSYTAELARMQSPWGNVEEVELTTFEYVWWWSHERLHGELGMRTPLEV